MMRLNLRHWQIAVVAAAVATVIMSFGTFFYLHSRNIMEDEIRERLRSIAAAAALHIDGDALDAIQRPADMEKPAFEDLVQRLQKLRELPDIAFVYILRPTQDPSALSFVADADLALSQEQLDRDGDGSVDPEEEPAYPGELYDISEVPALQGDAFLSPTVDKEVTADQWGLLVSGYAPIRRLSTGEVNAVLGIDMRADRFFRDSRQIFSPFGLALVLAGSILAGALIVMLAKKRQLDFMRRIDSERSGLLRLTFHQLGEPLTIMKWSLESLREQTDSPHLKELIDDHIVCMDEGLGRLDSIIDTLQLAEKIDLNTFEYVRADISLRTLIDDAVGAWEEELRAKKKRISIGMTGDYRLPLDRGMLSVVFHQIIANAVEYSDEGDVIELNTKLRKKDIVISIEDHGCGIASEDMEHMFEKYRRSKHAHLRKPDGNGLGLYICRGIIQKAGGKIWIESTENEGTKVSFTLPLA